MTDPNVIDRVKKILARTTEAGCTEAEAATAFRLASRLMTEHALDMAKVEEYETEGPGYAEACVFSEKRDNFEHSMASGICRDFFHVQTYITTGYESAVDARRTRRFFFGRPAHVETAKWVYGALVAAFDRLWADYHALNRTERGDRRTFVAGVANGFRAKLYAEREVVSADRDAAAGTGTTGTALAVISGQLAAAFKAKHPDLTTGRGAAPLRGSNLAYEAGQVAGRKLNLNRPIAGCGTKGLPG